MRVLVLLGLLVPAALWAEPVTYHAVAHGTLFGDRWLGGAKLTMADAPWEGRGGIALAEHGWLLSFDGIRHLDANFYVGGTLFVSREPNDEQFQARPAPVPGDDDDDDKRLVFYVPHPRLTADATEVGAGIILGLQGNRPGRPNSVAELHLTGLSNGPRAAALFGVRF